MKALLFDVQGTATDFFSTVRDALLRVLGGRYPQQDWAAFVNDWRAAYFDRLEASTRAGDEWISVDSVYRSALDVLLARHGLAAVTEDDRVELTRAWRRLTPWPDAVSGLGRLRSKYIVAALSNADVSAVIELSRHGRLPWDAIFTAEMVGAFKPDPRTYLLAARYLGLPPGEIMMVASHKYDIRAAGELGFGTAFVARPLEYGDPARADAAFSDEFDVNATDFNDLASQLGT